MDSDPAPGKVAQPSQKQSREEPMPKGEKMSFEEKIDLLIKFGLTDIEVARKIAEGDGRIVINTRSLNANNESGAQVFVLTDTAGKQIEGVPALVAFKGKLYPTNTVEKTSLEEIDLYGDFRISPAPKGEYGKAITTMTPAELIGKVQQDRRYVRVMGAEKEDGVVIHGAGESAEPIRIKGEFDFATYKAKSKGDREGRGGDATRTVQLLKSKGGYFGGEKKVEDRKASLAKMFERLSSQTKTTGVSAQSTPPETLAPAPASAGTSVPADNKPAPPEASADRPATPATPTPPQETPAPPEASADRPAATAAPAPSTPPQETTAPPEETLVPAPASAGTSVPVDNKPAPLLASLGTLGIAGGNQRKATDAVTGQSVAAPLQRGMPL
jgi:hypothetical protein